MRLCREEGHPIIAFLRFGGGERADFPQCLENLQNNSGCFQCELTCDTAKQSHNTESLRIMTYFGKSRIGTLPQSCQVARIK